MSDEMKKSGLMDGAGSEWDEGKRVAANVIVTAFAPRSGNYINTRRQSGKLLYEKKS